MSRIYSRASWGARYQDGVGTRPVGGLQKYLHHSVTTHLPATATLAQERVQCRVVESIGQQRFGRGISYTFLIFPSGRIHQGASVHRISYHSGGGRDGKPRNTLGVGICLVGNTDTNEMTPQQAAALVWLLQEGVRRGWWQDSAITEAHRDFKATACPGRHAYKRIAEINRRGRATANKPTPVTNPTTSSPGRDWFTMATRDDLRAVVSEELAPIRVELDKVKQAVGRMDPGKGRTLRADIENLKAAVQRVDPGKGKDLLTEIDALINQED